VQDLDLLRQTLEQTHPRIVAGEDAGRVETVDEELREIGQEPINALGECLKDQVSP
jgi:hypothetical protein